MTGNLVTFEVARPRPHDVGADRSVGRRWPNLTATLHDPDRPLDPRIRHVTPARAARTATTLVAAGVVALVLVLGLWQQVDAACEGADFDPSDPVATCQPPAVDSPGTVAVDPQPTSP